MDTIPEPQNDQSKKNSFFKELATYAAVALLIVIPVRTWIAQPFVVNGSSMDTTFKDGEYLIVDELTYKFRDPARGDVLIFKYPQDPSKYFIKRLIGLPGERVVIKNDKVSIYNEQYPSGMTLNEPYIHSRTFGNIDSKLGADEYFVMGDNRLVSSDSRSWGALPRKDLIGRPIIRLLPVTKIDLVPGVYSSSTLIAAP
jgi:signal peptidase I